MDLQQQARPLEAVAGSDPERPERVARLVAVVVGQRRPVGVEVLEDAPVVRARDVVDETRAGPQRALVPAAVAGGIAGRQEGLDHVHVRVRAPVGLGLVPAAVPGLAAGALLLGPEARLDHRDRLVEQRGRRGVPGHRGARGGEQDEGVRVGLLVRAHRAVGRDLGEPAAVFAVLEAVADRGEAVVDERPAARVPDQLAQREHVRHPRRDPQLQRPAGLGPAVGVEPAEAARHRCAAGELEQPRGLGREPVAVRLELAPAPAMRAGAVHQVAHNLAEPCTFIQHTSVRL